MSGKFSKQGTHVEQDDVDWNWNGDSPETNDKKTKTITLPKNHKGSQVKAVISSTKQDYYNFIKQNLYSFSFNSTYQYKYEHVDQVILQWRVEARDLNLPKGQKELNIKLLNLIKSNDILGLKEFLDNNKNNKDLKTVLDLKRDESGLTLLHIVCMGNQYDLTDYLLKAGADPNIQDCEGKTPLHYNTYSYDVVSLLMENKADPNIQDNRKKTALHYCADDIYPSDETIACVNVLLKNKANLSVMDNDKKTPMQIATDNNFYNKECFFNDKQKKLYKELYEMIKDTYEFNNWISSPSINNKNVESLKKFLDQNKDNEDLKIVLSNQNEEGDIKVLEVVPKDAVCNNVRKFVEDMAKVIGAVKVKKEVWVVEEGDKKATQSLFDAYLKQQDKMKLEFVNGLSQVQNMTELQGYVNKYINSGIMLNFIPKQHCVEDTDKNQNYLLDSVIERMSKLAQNPKIASNIICKLISQGAVLGNRNSLKLFDQQALKHGGYTGVIKAYDTHLHSHRNFVKIAEGAITSGKLNSAIMDNTTFYLEYSADSKIDVAKITNGTSSLGLVNGNIACGKDEVTIETRKDIIRIGKSEAEIETHNGKRNYTNLADNSDVVLTFYTSAGELKVRLYTNAKSKDLVKVEIMDKATLARLKDRNEKIGVNCSLGGLSVNEAIKQGFFIRPGKFQIPEVMHAYQKPPEKGKEGNDKKCLSVVEQLPQQNSPEEGKEGNDKKCQDVVEQLPQQQSPGEEKKGNDEQWQNRVKQQQKPRPQGEKEQESNEKWQSRVTSQTEQTIGK